MKSYWPLMLLFLSFAWACGSAPAPEQESVRPAVSVDPLVAGCKSGAVKSCLKAAEDAEHKGDTVAAAGLYEHACELGDVLGCLLAGGLYVQMPDGFDKGTDYLGQACGAGEMAGCYGLGLAWEGVYGHTPQPAKAMEVYQAACDNGMKPACERAGVLLLSSDPEAGITRLNLNCDAGEGSSCYELALFMLRNKKVAGTTALLSKGCELGDGESCAELGLSLSRGRDSDADDVAARAAFDRGCETVPPALRACAMSEWAKAKDGDMNAAGALENVCNAGEALGCFYRGMIAAQAAEPTTTWADKACALDAGLCTWFREQLKTGK